jgi:hypothetical protein
VLSPNARNFVRVNCGCGAVTVTLTLKEHDRVVGAASVALHWTSVVPTGNSEPDVRVQLTCTGAIPPEVLGAPKLTATGVPFADAALRFVGQAMESAGTAGGDVTGGCPGGCPGG